MPDIGDVIRERLRDAPDAADGVLAMQSALLAALGEHEPIEVESRPKRRVVCICPPSSNDPFATYPYPCPTVVAIARALGIEVGDD
jgi:hypothetical protein